MKAFTGDEWRLITGMGLLSGIRTLGASMIMPVFSFYALQQAGATERMVGVAIGVFGVSQTLFQVPMGFLSDRWGRKKMTLIGSMLFIAGAILCGLSRDIYSLTASRFVAGAGAVTGVAMTWITDGVAEERRNAAMACLGVCIGAAVIAGFPLSWVITGILDARWVFYATALSSMIAVGYTVFFVSGGDIGAGLPEVSYSGVVRCVRRLVGDPDMVRLIASGFIGSACLSGVFYIMPLMIAAGTHISHMWKIFAPAAIVGTAVMFCCVRKADTGETVRFVLAGFGLELGGVVLPMMSYSIPVLAVSLIMFYSGHCIIAPLLPVAVSRYPGQEAKGTVMSVFTMFQFLGMGAGGIASGLIVGFSSLCLFGVFAALIIVSLALMSGFGNFDHNPAFEEGLK